MGSKSSTLSDLTDRLSKLRTGFSRLSLYETSSPEIISAYGDSLRELQKELDQAIEEGHVKVEDHSCEELKESMRKLADLFESLLGEAQQRKVIAAEKRRAEEEKAAWAKQQRSLERQREVALESRAKERDNLLISIESIEGSLGKPGDLEGRERLEGLLKKKTKELREVDKELADLKDEENWFKQKRAQMAEQARLAEEKQRNLPQHPVGLPDLAVTKDQGGQLRHALEQLVEAGNKAGGYQQPDPSQQDAAIGSAAAAVRNLLDHSELNQAGHTSRIYDSVLFVVTRAYEAGYRIGDAGVREALKNVTISYASSAYDSDSGERDQDGRLLPGLYGDLSKIKIKK
jgi:hypothetical protein